MRGTDWRPEEVDAIVDDYLAMLALELAGQRYSKTEHRKALRTRQVRRSNSAVEWKHQNISAVLLEAGFPYIRGYKPGSHYQELLSTVVLERLAQHPQLQSIAAADADRPAVVPEVEDLLAVWTNPPGPRQPSGRTSTSWMRVPPLPTNYLEREALNRSLGAAGEQFVLQYERARLIHAGRPRLAERIEHTSRLVGDHAGYDVRSFDVSGADLRIEVKTTKYGERVPFYVSRNELRVSEQFASSYCIYRIHSFSTDLRMFSLPGAISGSCALDAASYIARPK